MLVLVFEMPEVIHNTLLLSCSTWHEGTQTHDHFGSVGRGIDPCSQSDNQPDIFQCMLWRCLTEFHGSKFGDLQLKSGDDFHHFHPKIFTPSWDSARLATDGVWDVLSSSEVRQLCTGCESGEV